MPRPFCRRRIAGAPAASVFKPAGIPIMEIDEVVITLDEFEAVRLADLDRLYQEKAAEQMGVSRPTFSRIIDAARHKMADAIVDGKALEDRGRSDRPSGRQCCRVHDRSRCAGRRGTIEGEEVINVCIPVGADRGTKSGSAPDFGSSPLFMIVDTDQRVAADRQRQPAPQSRHVHAARFASRRVLRCGGGRRHRCGSAEQIALRRHRGLSFRSTQRRAHGGGVQGRDTAPGDDGQRMRAARSGPLGRRG